MKWHATLELCHTRVGANEPSYDDMMINGDDTSLLEGLC